MSTWVLIVIDLAAAVAFADTHPYLGVTLAVIGGALFGLHLSVTLLQRKGGAE